MITQLPEFDSIENVSEEVLRSEAEHLGYESNAPEDDLRETLNPFTDKAEYRARLSREFCRENGLRVRGDLNSNQRRKLTRIFEGDISVGRRSGLPYGVKKE